jgi:hypothetical protein
MMWLVDGPGLSVGAESAHHSKNDRSTDRIVPARTLATLATHGPTQICIICICILNWAILIAQTLSVRLGVWCGSLLLYIAICYKYSGAAVSYRTTRINSGDRESL